MREYLIIKHSDDTHSIDECPARQLAAKILDDISLTGEEYYKEEDRITSILNNLCTEDLSHRYWEREVRYQMENNLDIEDCNVKSTDEDGIIKEIADKIILKSEYLWGEINSTIKGYVDEQLKKYNKEEK